MPRWCSLGDVPRRVWEQSLSRILSGVLTLEGRTPGPPWGLSGDYLPRSHPHSSRPRAGQSGWCLKESTIFFYLGLLRFWLRRSWLIPVLSPLPCGKEGTVALPLTVWAIRSPWGVAYHIGWGNSPLSCRNAFSMGTATLPGWSPELCNPGCREQLLLCGPALGTTSSGSLSTPRCLLMLQEGGPLPGPKRGLLSNTQEWIVWGDTSADKARDFIGKGLLGGKQEGQGNQEDWLPRGSQSGVLRWCNFWVVFGQ